MSEFEKALGNERERVREEQAAHLAAEIARKRQLAEAIEVDYSDPRVIFGEQLAFAFDFMRTMRNYGMSDAITLYKQDAIQPYLTERLFEGKRKRDVADPVRGYLIGVENTRETYMHGVIEGYGEIYFCEDERLYKARHRVTHSGNHKIAEPLTSSDFVSGEFHTIRFEHSDAERADRLGSFSTHGTATSFRSMPLNNLLPQIAARKLGA